MLSVPDTDTSRRIGPCFIKGMKKNYYKILGIAKTAAADEIKDAYRQRVKECHPDTCPGSDNEDKIRDLNEAYETLADRDRRRKYDRERIGPAGPLHDDGITGWPGGGPSFDWGNPRGIFSDIFESIFANARRKRNEFDISLELTLDETRSGGNFTITLPVRERCPECGGPSFWSDNLCPVCQGAGIVIIQKKLTLVIPPHTMDGDYMMIAGEDIGLPGITFHITVTVDMSN